MRYAHFLGLVFLIAAGCSDKPSPVDTVRQAGPIVPASDLNPLPQAPSAPDQPLPQVATGDYQPIPQDLARIEKRLQEMLEWNRRTLVGAYEKIGEKEPKWDKSAREALELAARMFSLQIDPIISLKDIAIPAKAAIDAGCNDSLIHFFYARSQPRNNEAATRLFKNAARAFGSSRYPAWRRASALTISVPGELQPGPEGDAFRKEAQAAFDTALTLLPESVATDEREEFWEDRWFDTLLSILRGYRWLGMDGPAAYQKIDDALAKVPEVEVLRLQFRANFWLHSGWEARTKAFAPNVPADGFRKLEECLFIAKDASEEAWRIRPEGARTPENLLEIDKAIGGDRATMELWFERAMNADGNHRAACWSKLDWLDPKWHGSVEEMLAFGRACRDTKNSRTGITLLAADAHWRVACMPGQSQFKYLSLPEVWADIKSVYDEYLKYHPDDDVARCKFATFSHLSAHYREAEVQYVALGDRLNRWTEIPWVPLGQLKQNRERNAKVVLGKEGRITFPGWHFTRATDVDSELFVNFPAGPSHQEKPGIPGAGKTHVWNCTADGIAYLVRAQILPPALRNDKPELILETARAVVAKERGAQPRNLRETLLAARPAQEYDIDLPGPKPMRVRVKTVVIGRRLYELSVTAGKEDVTGRAANEFFDSCAVQVKADPALDAS